ncbi:MAG: UDP-2,3-diacylglucosamine hydrolase [Algoriphagus sp.]|jgi:UDP-2,3-diacylglucosamine hydrolase
MHPRINLLPNKKIYFASDFHLGAPSYQKSLIREKKIVAWLEQIKGDAQIIFLVGDLFDFWFEYKKVIPKGYSRFFGKLAELSDAGIELKIFTGNHDLWMKDYFQEEFGAEIYHEPQVFTFSDRSIYIGHGDGLGAGDTSYKLLKKFLFTNPICTFLFGRMLHPNLGMALGNLWSLSSWKRNRAEDKSKEEIKLEKEFLYQYALDIENSGNPHDFYIFGHRHIAIETFINKTAKYVNLGDWIRFDSYAVFDGKDLKLVFHNS